MRTPSKSVALIGALLSVAVSGCSGGGRDEPKYVIGGAVTGLTGSGLVLATPGQPHLIVAAGATSFAFATPVVSGSAYTVSVVQQPISPAQTCTVASGTGVVDGADVTSIRVTCVVEGPPPTTLTLTCGTYNASPSVGVVLAVTLDPARSVDTALTVEGAGVRKAVVCPAGQRLCLVALPEVSATRNSGYSIYPVTVTGDLGAGQQAWTCSPNPANLLPQPEGRAEAIGGLVTATWSAVPGAALYRATLRDLGPPGVAPASVLGAATTSATQATFTLAGAPPALAVVEVEAWATDPGSPPSGALPSGGANRSMRALPLGAAPWTLHQPSDFAAGTLTLTVPSDRRLAVLLLNVAGPEGAPATIQASGTGISPAPAPALAPPAAALAPRGPAGLELGWSSGPSPSLPARRVAPPVSDTAPPLTTSFCTPYCLHLDCYGLRRRQASLIRETPTALFYVDDANQADFSLADWDSLTATWEVSQAWVTDRSGPPPDIDGNGKVVLFFTGSIGSRYAGWVVFQTESRDTTAACTGSGSNQADMILMRSLVGFEDASGAPVSPADTMDYVTSTLAHEFQHLVDQKRFCLDRAGCPRGDTWITEGRATLTETMAGMGFHMAAMDRGDGLHVFRRAGPGGGYSNLRLLPWETNYVNYSASGWFLLYLADRLGPDFVTALYQDVNTLAQLEATSGLPFPVAYGLWASALLFSNQPASPWPVLDYTAEGLTPIHQVFQRLEYAPLDAGAARAVTLRANGLDVYVTGAAGAGGGTVTVTSLASMRPYVVAIPFTGALP